MALKNNQKIAFLTAGGIAPCLSASIGALIMEYAKKLPDGEMIGYSHGYKGLLLGNYISINEKVKKNANILFDFGGSPIGNSRVKLTNTDDCVNRGFIKKGQDPLEVAAQQLVKDNVSILHTIGGDDTNTMAASLVDILDKKGIELTVVGLPKTVDNDVYPIFQTLGASTAAEQSSIFFENISNENTTSHRQLIIHEVMGRNCGWLTAASAKVYRKRLELKRFLPDILIAKKRWDIHAIYIPESNFDFNKECIRLKKIMDENDCVNIFLSEGAGIDTIIKEKENIGEEIQRDAFGHIRLDSINPGNWFAKKFGERLNADKILVQKSGYFARSAPANNEDLDLIKKTAIIAVEEALKGKSGVVGLDNDNNGLLGLIDFNKIKGGKPFDPKTTWFQKMLTEIGQISN